MIRRAITLDTQDVTIRIAWIEYAYINVKARHTYLRMVVETKRFDCERN
jgi:hypothetical protein